MTYTPPSRARRQSQVRGAGVIPPDQAEIEEGSERTGMTSPFLNGALAGVQAVVLGLAVVALPMVVLWLLAPGRSSMLDAARVAVITWLVGHRTGLSTAAGTLRVAPLGLSLILGACIWFFARRTGRALAFAGATDQGAWRAHAGLVVSYVVLGATLCLLSPTAQLRPEVESAVVGLAVLSAVASAPSIWGHRITSSWRRARSRRAAWVHAGLSALAFPAAVTLLLVVAAVVAGFSRISSLFDALHPGPAGSVGLALVHMTVLPNVVVWLLSWLAGPGFWVGMGTQVTSSQTVLGPLPALPLLGALPAPGHHPSWLAPAAVGVVVLGGVLGGRSLGRWHRDAGTTSRDRMLDVLAAAGICGVVAALLSWWASGPLGAGVMAWWGIARPIFPLVLAAEVAVGLMIGALAESAFGRRRRSDDDS